jgi:tetratricopeptide (TPR) repeat protein
MKSLQILVLLVFTLLSCGYSGLKLEREGDDFLKNQDYDKAIEKYTEALIEDTSLFKSRFNRGRCYYYKSNYEKAANDFKSATYLKPTDSICFFNLGLSLLALNKAPEALVAFDQAVKLQMSSPNLKLQKANCLFKMGEYQKASSLYTQILPYFSDSMSVYKSRGISFYQTNRMTAAFIDFETYLKQNSSPSILYEFAGIAATKIGAYKKAITYFDKLIDGGTVLVGEAQDYMIQAIVKQSSIDFALGKVNESIELLTKAIVLYPHSKQAYLQRGRVFLSLGKSFEACEDLNTAFIYGGIEAEELLKTECPEYYQ